jgi:hypothetical protein
MVVANIIGFIDPSDRPVKYNHDIHYDVNGAYTDNGNYNDMVDLSGSMGVLGGNEDAGQGMADHSTGEDVNDDDDDDDAKYDVSDSDNDDDGDNDNGDDDDEDGDDGDDNGDGDDGERQRYISQAEQEQYLIQQETDLLHQLNQQKVHKYAITYFENS